MALRSIHSGSNRPLFTLNSSPFLLIPYEHVGVERFYELDYIVRRANGVIMLFEVKGKERTKRQGERRRCTAVNHRGKLDV